LGEGSRKGGSKLCDTRSGREGIRGVYEDQPIGVWANHGKTAGGVSLKKREKHPREEEAPSGFRALQSNEKESGAWKNLVTDEGCGNQEKGGTRCAGEQPQRKGGRRIVQQKKTSHNMGRWGVRRRPLGKKKRRKMIKEEPGEAEGGRPRPERPLPRVEGLEGGKTAGTRRPE